MTTFVLYYATALLGASAGAEIVHLPAYAGRVINYGEIKNERFMVAAYVACEEPTGGSCGVGKVFADVAADGTYEIGAMDLDVGDVPAADRTYVTRSELIYNGPRNDARKGAFQISMLEDEALVRLPKGEDPSSERATVFTILQLNPTILKFNHPDGGDPVAWLRGVGRGASVSIGINFGERGRRNPRVTFSQYGTALKFWERTRVQPIALHGEWPVDPPVEVTATISSTLDREVHQTIFNSDVNRMIPNGIKITHDTGERPEARVIDGVYPASKLNIFNDRYSPVRTGTFYARFRLRCVNGQIDGRVEYRAQEDESSPTQFTVPATGPCNGETGTLKFNWLDRQRKPFPVQVNFSRVSAVAASHADRKPDEVIQKRVYADRQAYDHPELIEADFMNGLRDYTVEMPVLDQKGRAIGFARIQTEAGFLD